MVAVGVRLGESRLETISILFCIYRTSFTDCDHCNTSRKIKKGAPEIAERDPQRAGILAVALLDGILRRKYTCARADSPT
ncbi:MAG: hypothetical protein DDT34_01958 [Firmicutes bacterium]|nr:hypothetical protein [Bacillota bacterium]